MHFSSFPHLLYVPLILLSFELSLQYLVNCTSRETPTYKSVSILTIPAVNSNFVMTNCTEAGRNPFELGFEGNGSYGIFKIWYFVCFLVCLATLSESYVLYSVEMQNHYKQYLGMMWKKATCSVWSYSPGMCLEMMMEIEKFLKSPYAASEVTS
jgi:hypothetical protein